MDFSHLDRAPTDELGYIKSFSVENVDEIRQFFAKYGFVCIKNVLSDEQVDETVQEFFGQFNKEDVDSIENFYGSQPFARMGIIGSKPNAHSFSLLENRQNKQVYKAFSTVLDEKQLIVDHDRLGAMRPTFWKGKEKAEWRTIDRWLHLDCNPLNGKVSVGSFAKKNDVHDWNKCDLLQGFISLTDAKEEDGGFHCVPGGHKIAREWAKLHNYGDAGATLVVGQDDPLRNYIQKISIPKGCLFVWSAFLFHANRPNYSERWRIVQYIRMYPALTQNSFEPLFPDEKDYPMHFQMTALGRKLFGIEKY